MLTKVDTCVQGNGESDGNFSERLQQRVDAVSKIVALGSPPILIPTVLGTGKLYVLIQWQERQNAPSEWHMHRAIENMLSIKDLWLYADPVKEEYAGEAKALHSAYEQLKQSLESND